MRVAFFALLLLFQASSFAVPDCSELQDRWYSKYTKDFNISWSNDEFVCPGGESLFALSLWDLETVQFQPNSNGYKPDFYNYVYRLINNFKFDKECTSIASEIGGNITLCPPFFDDTREDRASTLVHESRHADSDDPGHVTCVGGANDGKTRACDDTFYDGALKGSGFNADVHFMSWVMGEGNELSDSIMQGHINTFVPDRFNTITSDEISKWRN